MLQYQYPKFNILYTFIKFIINQLLSYSLIRIIIFYIAKFKELSF